MKGEGVVHYSVRKLHVFLRKARWEPSSNQYICPNVLQGIYMYMYIDWTAFSFVELQVVACIVLFRFNDLCTCTLQNCNSRQYVIPINCCLYCLLFHEEWLSLYSLAWTWEKFYASMVRTWDCIIKQCDPTVSSYSLPWSSWRRLV